MHDASTGELFETHWLPDTGFARGHVVLVHGYGEHCGRYGQFARHLNDAEIAVHAFDLRGMGRSSGRRGRIDSMTIIDADFDGFVSSVETQGAPLFLFGHSFGGLVVSRYLLRNGHAVRGAVLSAPAFLPRPVLPAILRPLTALLARVVPSLPVMTVRRNLLSRDPAVVADARRDFLNTGRVVDARTAHQFAGAGFAMLEQLRGITTPLLILQGTDDRIVDARGSYALYNEAASEDKTLAVFEGGYHEVLNDTVRDDAIRCVSEWIIDRAG